MLNSNTHPYAARQQWLAPIACAILFGGVAFLVTSLLPRTYRAESSLYFPSGGDTSNGLLSAVSGLSRFGNVAEKGGQVSLFGGALVSPQVASAPQTAIAVLSSRRLRERVADQLKLSRAWNLPRDKAVKRLADAAALGVDKNGLLALSVDDRDPALAAAIASSYITNLRDLAKDLSLGLSTRNRKFLEGRLATVRARLGELERKSLAATEREPNAALASGAVTKAAEALINLETDRAKARIALDSVRAQIEWQNQALGAAVKSGAELPAHSEIAQEERIRLSQVEARFAVARSQYGPDHPRFRLLQEELKNAREQLDREIQRESRALESGVAPEVIALRAKQAASEAQVAGMDRAVEDVQGRLAGLPRRQMEREKLQQEIKGLRGLIEYLEAETERARVAETRESTTFEVIDAPQVPTEAVAPRRLFSTLLSALAGLLLGAGWVVARSLRRDSSMERALAVRADDIDAPRERVMP